MNRLFLVFFIMLDSDSAHRKAVELKECPGHQGMDRAGGGEGVGVGCLLCLMRLPYPSAGRADGVKQHSHQATGAALDQHLSLCLPQH